MKLQVLGLGCPSCMRLAANTAQAVCELGTDCTVEKVTDIGAIVQAGASQVPALVIDGQVRMQGRVPGVDEIKALLR